LRPRVHGLARYWERIAIAGVACAALATALLWVYLVPLLQGSDESDHFDYALSIARAGHLLSANHPLGFPAADPETDFLETYTGFPSLYLNGSSRVVDGYGSHDFFTEIDRRSRQQLRDPHEFFNARQHPVPVLVSMYPFGYYAANAVWLHIFWFFDPSLVSVLFAARWFSAMLLIATVIASYATARQLAYAPAVALLLAGIVGSFPLTTFVSSYVQPDALSMALVASCFALALRARRTLGGLDLAATGMALGALTITKYQFGLSVGLAIAAAIGARLLERRRAWRTRVLAIVWLVAPTLTLLAIQTAVIGSNRDFTADTSTHFKAFSGLTTLPQDGARFGVQLARGVWYSFVGNLEPELTSNKRYAAAISFWGVFGWLDTPLTFGSHAVDLAVRRIVQSLTIAAILACAVVVVRNVGRLLRLARCHRIVAALRIASANVPVNAYLAFVAFMLMFYALTDNAWRTSGRTWAPMMLPAFILGTRYAPRVLPRRPARIVGAGLVAMLVVYATVGGVFAGRSVEHRYYGRPVLYDVATLRPGALTSIVVDHVNAQSTDVAPAGVPYVNAGDPIDVTGYAIDLAKDAAATGVFARIDGRDDVIATYGYAHQDVADRLADPAFFWSGFVLRLPTVNLGRGPHVAALYVVSSDGLTASPTGASVHFVVVNRSPRLPAPLSLSATGRPLGTLDALRCHGPASPYAAAADGTACGDRQRLVLAGTIGASVMGTRLVVLVDGRIAARGAVRTGARRTFALTAPLRGRSPGFHDASLALARGGRARTILADVPFAIYRSDVPARAVTPVAPARPASLDLPSGRVEITAFAASADVAPAGDIPIWIRRTDPVTVRGSVLVRGATGRARTVVLIDGDERFAVTSSAAGRRGPAVPFAAHIPPNRFALGPHRLAIEVRTQSGRRERTASIPFAVYR